MFPKRGEATARILNIWKPAIAAREMQDVRQRPPLPDTCPNCGKRLGRGKWMHLKTCGKKHG